MIQKGLFVIFFENHAMQEKVFFNFFWNIGQTMFRALPWSPKGKIKDVAQRFSPFWVEILGVQLELWPFLSQILNPLGSIL